MDMRAASVAATLAPHVVPLIAGTALVVGVAGAAGAAGGAGGAGAVGAAGAAGARDASQLASARTGSGPAIGLAHVDLMDLHLERLPGGGIRRREVLSPDELSQRYEMAAASGAGWNRWSLYWDMIDRDAGPDWSVSDEIVERDRDAGLRTLAIVQGTPSRYATGGSHGAAFPQVGGYMLGNLDAPSGHGDVSVQASVPRSLHEPAFLRSDGSTTDDPAEAAGANPANPWSSFVAEAVERYRPGGTLASALGWESGEGVGAWEIGNEPNLRHFWDGTPAEYARYLEVAYLVIEWRDPRATVVHGGIADDASASDWYGQFLDALISRTSESPLPARYGYYFDAAGWHWYSYPALLGTGPDRARSLLRDRGLPVKPIWVTEMGVPIWSEHPGPCWDPTSPWRATAAEQAGYMWQAVAEGRASGVELAVHFQTYDDCGNGPESYDAFGLLRNHASNQCWTPPDGQACWRFDPSLAGKPRPAYQALAAAADLIGPAHPLWRSGRVDDWERVLLYLPPDKRVTVAWNWSRSDRDVEITATGPEGTLHAMDGSGAISERVSRPTGGRHAATLPGQTNNNNPGGGGLMAGRPVILVERDTYAPYRADIEPLPDVSPAAFDLTVSAADGGTGVGAVRVIFADRPPAGPSDWQVWASEVAWTDSPVGGRAAVPFSGEPGTSYYFGAQALDRAGNWSAPPSAAQASTRIEGQSPQPSPSTQASPPPSSTRGVTATPTPSASATPTATVEATGTPTVVATGTPTMIAPPTSAASPGPPPILDKSIALPAALRRAEPCDLIGVKVRGPRGDPLSDPRGTWTLRSFSDDAEVTGTTQALGTSACAGPGASRVEAWAVVPGYVTDAPQDLSLSRELYQAVAPNSLINGGFEAGLAGWALSGDLPPERTSAALAGAGGAELGAGGSEPPGADTGASSELHQELVVPTRSATLALRYRFVSDQVCDDDGCWDIDRVRIRLVGVDSPDGDEHDLTGPDGLRPQSAGWEHASFDLAAAAGKRVKVVITLQKAMRSGPGRLLLDNVSIGPASPGGTEWSQR